MSGSEMLTALAFVLFLVGLVAVANRIVLRENARVAEAQRVKDERAAERLHNPPPPEVLIQERLDAIEAANAVRFDSLKSRIFWTPLLWAVVGAVLWGLASALAHA